MSPPFKSSIARCTVTHQRHKPAKHGFSYPIYTFVLHLDELQKLDKEFSFFGYNRFAIHSLYDKDYLYRGDESIKTKLLHYLEKEGIDGVEDIYLVTQAKFFGMVFNPVSFYFCYESRKRNANLKAMICEVNNTFHERHLYILKRDTLSKEHQSPFYVSKEFHVSPFNNMEGEYQFRFADIRDRLDVKISLDRDGGVMFFARLEGVLDKITKKTHISTVLHYPLVPLVTVPRIFYQAFKLFFRRKLKFYDKPVPRSHMTILKNRPSWLHKKCHAVMDEMFSKIEHGHLTVTMPEGEYVEYGKRRSGRNASLQINDWPFFTKLMFDGDVGFGEAYVEGLWTTKNLSSLLMLLLDNYEIIKPEQFRAALVSRMMGRMRYLKEKNSVEGSRHNIHKHYDLSNDFFKLFLDPAMVYSSGMFLSTRDTLRKSQLNKIHTIIDKAKIKKSDHVLELGCGWGGFAVEAVKKTGCKVTAVTVSEEQHKYVSELIKKTGTAKNIHVELKDYRQVEGVFNKIISIEMAEAVGSEYLGDYFEAIDTHLEKDGIAVLQVITMPDQRHARYKREYDWIKKYIFPGGHLLSTDEINTTLKKRTSLYIHNLENIGVHYAKTLSLWSESFHKNIAKVEKLGFDQAFIRKWDYYLASSEALFETRTINNCQFVLSRPNNYNL